MSAVSAIQSNPAQAGRGVVIQRPSISADELSAIIMRQADECADLKRRFFAENAKTIIECCRAMAARFDAGGRLFAMGNGGSSCDAIHCSVEFMHPIIEKRPALPSIALTTDEAIVTAIGNDQDFSMVFSQQLQMLGKPGDMLLGTSTSGKSANLIRAFKVAKEIGMMTIGFAGKDGGRMAGVGGSGAMMTAPSREAASARAVASEICDFCLIVPSFSIPRIQEVHQTLLHIVWDLVHVIRGEEDVL